MTNLDLGVAITPASVFDAASISRQFTAMSILLLAQRGQLSLHDGSFHEAETQSRRVYPLTRSGRAHLDEALGHLSDFRIIENRHYTGRMRQEPIDVYLTFHVTWAQAS